MNTIQIKYFLTTAQYLNITKAAQKLYISQPALSKQLHTIEDELGMELFIKSGKKMQLSPAGKVLYEELRDFDKTYEGILRRAKMANEGRTGILRIGLLEGQMLGDVFMKTYQAFISKYPTINFQLERGSFSVLQDKLRRGDIDLAVSLSFDVAEEEDLSYTVIAEGEAFLAVSKNHPAAHKYESSWEDLKDETFIVISPKDSKVGSQMLIVECQRQDFEPKVDFAPSLESVMLWVEAGLGIGIVDSMNYLTLNPGIALLRHETYLNTETALVWCPDNLNPTAKLFIDMIKEAV